MVSFTFGYVLLALFSTAYSSPTTPEQDFSQSKAFPNDQPEPIPTPARILCDVCQSYASHLKYFFVDNATGIAGTAAMETLCNLTSNNPKICYGLFGGIWIYAYVTLDGGTKDNSLCKRLTMCDYPYVPTPSLQRKYLHEACVFFVQSFQPTILANTTLPLLQRIVNNFCPDFPTPEEKQKCQTFASTGLPVLYQTVADAVKNPNNTCKKYNSSPQEMQVSEPSQNQPPNPDHQPQYMLRAPSCNSCKIWAQVLKPIFSSNKLLDHVTKAFHSYCDSLGFPAFLKYEEPSNYRSFLKYDFKQSVVQCRSVFDSFVPMTWRLLGQEMKDPEKFCVKFTLCNASQPEVDEEKIAPQPHNPDLCKACQAYAMYIKPVVINETIFLDRVMTAVDNLCAAMPLPLLRTNKCAEETEEFVGNIYESAQEFFEDNDFCTQLTPFCH